MKLLFIRTLATLILFIFFGWFIVSDTENWKKEQQEKPFEIIGDTIVFLKPGLYKIESDPSWLNDSIYVEYTYEKNKGKTVYLIK